MNELDTRAERFLESIRAEGEAACAAIREETERAINSQLDETRRTENARVERTLRFETERAKTRANRDLSAARMAARATLAAQRQKIADETFSKAREQLAACAMGAANRAMSTSSGANSRRSRDRVRTCMGYPLGERRNPGNGTCPAPGAETRSGVRVLVQGPTGPGRIGSPDCPAGKRPQQGSVAASLCPAVCQNPGVLPSFFGGPCGGRGTRTRRQGSYRRARSPLCLTAG